MLFGAETTRLLRKQWPTPTMLAQELYAMFQGNIPLSTSGLTINNPTGSPAITINQTNPLPGFVVNRGGQPVANLGNIGGNSVTLGNQTLTGPTSDIQNNPGGLSLGALNLSPSGMPMGEVPSFTGAATGPFTPGSTIFQINNPNGLPPITLGTTSNGGLNIGAPSFTFTGPGGNVINLGGTDTTGTAGQASPAGGGLIGKVVSGSGTSHKCTVNGKTVTVNTLGVATGESIPAGSYLIVVQSGSSYSAAPPVFL